MHHTLHMHLERRVLGEGSTRWKQLAPAHVQMLLPRGGKQALQSSAHTTARVVCFVCSRGCHSGASLCGRFLGHLGRPTRLILHKELVSTISRCAHTVSAC